jgi:very-short-patch-repair endonuclease
MTVAQALADIPVDRVVQVRGGSLDTVAAAAADGLGDLAAVVVGPASCATPRAFVRDILDDLERVAIALLPGWLPDAAEIHRPDPAGLAAVRAAALTRAHGSPHLALFLTELAAVALSGRRVTTSDLPLETRSIGLARVVAEGFGRAGVLLLAQVPAGLTADGERAMVAGAEWLAHQGRLGVWLVGSPLRQVDRVPVVQAPELPLSQVAALSTGLPTSGKPHPGSATEAALEAALTQESWAIGRRWNQTYQSHALTAPVRLDLLWPDERCVIELDGPEHCHPARFEADRQRDVQLQLDGFAVLRFTNARVSHDVGTVVRQIGAYLRSRRRDIAEGRDHGRR